MNLGKLVTDMARLTCAQVVRGILSHSNAHWHTLITCTELEHTLDQLGYRVSLVEVLELITKEDVQAGRVPCTAVVIDPRTRQPWGGFFNRLRDLDVELDDEYEHWVRLLSQLRIVPYTAAEQRERSTAPRHEQAASRGRRRSAAPGGKELAASGR